MPTITVSPSEARAGILDDESILAGFTDGAEGVIDMSDSVGSGIFAPLADPNVFARAYVGDHGQIAWSEEMEICPDAAYLEASGKIPRETLHA